jgi:tetratricopeptide (TPR) repeat protein
VDYDDSPSYGGYQYELSRCRQLLDEEDFGEAFRIATDLLERAPEDAEVISAFADAAVAIGEPSEALRACARFLKSGGHDLEVLEWLARGQWDLHLTEQCRETCRRILRVDPENYTALDYGLATALELGDFEQAKDIIDRAADHRPEDRHLAYQTAVARMMRGEEDWARNEFERFLDENPDDPGTYINLMRIHHLGKRFEKVEELFREAARRKIDHEDIQFNMGLALKAQEKDLEAARFFIRTIRMNAELPEAHFHLGQVLRMEGHPRLGLMMLERELRVDDTRPAVHAEMAWCAEDIEDYDAAVRMIRAAVERAPDWGVYRHSLAELIMKAGGDRDEALEAALEAVRLDPKHAAGWQVLGRLSAEDGDLKAAEMNLRRAVQAKDATAEDEGWLGLLLVEVDRRDDARPLLENAVRTFPYWIPVGDALALIRGGPIARRFEMRIRLKGYEPIYRVLHIVAADEAAARATARSTLAGADPEPVVEEVRDLGFDVDLEPGLAWDSGSSADRFPEPPV